MSQRSEPAEPESAQALASRIDNARAATEFAFLGVAGALLANVLGAVALLVTLGLMAAGAHGRLAMPALSGLRLALSYFAIGVFVAIATATMGYLGRSFLFREGSMSAVPFQLLGASAGLVGGLLFSLGAIAAADALVGLLGA
jgi:hypothetical protein